MRPVVGTKNLIYILIMVGISPFDYGHGENLTQYYDEIKESRPSKPVECEDMLGEYNEYIRLYRFKNALDILRNCSERCPQQKDICLLQSISLKATMRNYIDVQLKTAREAKEANPGGAIRAYRRVLEIAGAYSEKSEAAVSEAERELPGLNSEVDREMAVLVRNGEQAITAFRFDRLRDIIYKLYLLDYGSTKAQDLSQSASKKIDEYISNESKEIDRLLQTLDETVSATAKISSPGNRRRENRISKVTQTINNKIEAALAVKPGDERINQLYVRAVSTKDQAQGKGLKIQLIAPDKQLTESPEKVLQEALTDIGKRKYGQAVENLERSIARVNFDKDDLCAAYVYLGIAYASQIKEERANTLEGGSVRSAAIRAFRRALSFNPNLQLPKGHDNFKPLLEESRHLEDPRIDLGFGPR
jgi:hypothetical protein